MQILIGDLRYKLGFTHIRDEAVIRQMGLTVDMPEMPTLPSRVTRCEISLATAERLADTMNPAGYMWRLTAHGYAFCSPKDNFCKERGRKVALARALKYGGFAQPERAVFWSAYFARCK